MPKIYIEGCKMEIASGQNEGIGEVVLTHDIEFHGVQVMLEDPIYGDELDFRVIAPDGTTIVGDYSTNTFITSKVNDIEIKAETKDAPSDIPAGFILRMTYTAVDTNGRKSVVWYRTKR